MRLNDLMSKPFDENLKEMEVTSFKPIIDDNGNLVKVIVEYSPKNTSNDTPFKPKYR